MGQGIYLPKKPDNLYDYNFQYETRKNGIDLEAAFAGSSLEFKSISMCIRSFY